MNTTTQAYLGTAAATTACAIVGGLASDPGSAWYRSLDKPSWNPPNAAFPIVWTTLYTDIAVTGGRVMSRLKRAGRNDEARSYAVAFGTNLVLNAAWSYVFFRAHRPGLAAVWAGVLAASSTDLVRRTAQVDTAAGIALAPYAAWTTFATALSSEFWRRNR